RPHQPSGGAVREGSALLQGVAVCGHCGRKLRTHYTGRTASAGYHCAGKTITNGRGVYCLRIGAVQVDQAVAQAALAALAPLGIEASLAAGERLEVDSHGALAPWRLAVERTSYEAQRTERRYRAVDLDNRLVSRGLEAEWEKALRELETAKAELARREQQRPRTLSVDERIYISPERIHDLKEARPERESDGRAEPRRSNERSDPHTEAVPRAFESAIEGSPAALAAR